MRLARAGCFLIEYRAMKTIIATVGAVMTAVTLGAQGADEKSVETEEEETPIFEAGFDFDWFSAYVWRNAVQNDDMVMQPCVWADLTCFEPFWLGFSIWENYDLTDRNRSTYRYGVTETDYNVHLGATAWESEDEDFGLDLEIGHDWYTYHGVHDKESCPDTAEIYVKATFANPFVDVYGQASWMYRDFGAYGQAMHYELGFNKEIELTDTLTLGADWNFNFGDPRYLGFLYGDCEFRNFDDEDEPEDCSHPDGGIAGTTFKLYLNWAIADWVSLKGTVAYTGVLNGSARQGLGDDYNSDWWGDGTDDRYERDLFWGGLSLNFAF